MILLILHSEEENTFVFNLINDVNGNQNVAAYGEINDPVIYWGDFPHKFGTHKSPFPGAAYGFIIEYNQKP